MAQDWIWVAIEVAQAAHLEQLAEHGGAAGVRDARLLESAMARPQNLVAYGEPDAAELAAAYAFGIARNHPFVDGNKRTAAVVSETFLVLNGYQLAASDAELVVAFLALAAGELSVLRVAGLEGAGHLEDPGAFGAGAAVRGRVRPDAGQAVFAGWVVGCVTAAVVLPWSNGQVEGQIHRLKLVKRQMYGRAKFNLLRIRVLPSESRVILDALLSESE